MLWTTIHEGWRSIDESRTPSASPSPAPSPGAPRRRRSWFGWLSNAPWWLISAGLHAVLILAAALVYVERAMDLEGGEVEVRISAPAEPLAEIERPRDLFERKGVPKDDPADAVEEPAIFFPEAKDADHNETANDEDYRRMKGDSMNFLGSVPGDAGGPRGRTAGRAAGMNDSMGVGGGGGGSGRYGGRFGGRQNLVARGGGSGTEDAVRAALRWLARHQSTDGSWDSEDFPLRCVGEPCSGQGYADFGTGTTGLALLAFLGAGYSHLSKDEVVDPLRPGRTIRYGDVVRAGLKWLVSAQDADGCIGPRRGHYLYNHCIASLALSEAYGMTNASLLLEPAQRAISFIAAAQNPRRGWRYTPRSGDNDTSVTGWAVMALKSADIAGLEFPDSCYAGARTWFDEVTEGTYGRSGYSRKPVAGRGERWPSATAIAVMSRIFMDKNKADPRLATACDQLLHVKPAWEEGAIDYYYWYYGSLALFQFDGPSGPKWRAWNEDMKTTLVGNQNRGSSACRNGSWDAIDMWSRAGGGRIYATAINALTLEVYYRYANVFGTK